MHLRIVLQKNVGQINLHLAKAILTFTGQKSELICVDAYFNWIF